MLTVVAGQPGTPDFKPYAWRCAAPAAGGGGGARDARSGDEPSGAGAGGGGSDARGGGRGGAVGAGADGRARGSAGAGGVVASKVDFPPLTLAPRRALDAASGEVGAALGLPSVAYYPDFVTPEEEGELLASTYLAAAPWHPLRKRRLQMYGGTPAAEGMRAQPLPPFMHACARALVEAGVFAADAPPNHVLLNEYEPGQGIMPHKDGPLYHPVVAILSLRSSCCLDFWPSLEASSREGGAPVASVLCRPRSLLVFREAAYTDVWHSIRERDADPITDTVANRDMLGLEVGDVVVREDTRVSFTIRRVLNVLPSSGDGDDGDDVPATAEAADEARRRHAQMLHSVSDDR
uniref:Fe2OG dioxygenase domain-containing protein n=1 Tax=Bicosoecida sp. CB-2014 TaxID=1486930 RepID=A0A7S1GBR1_9STRA|mmetsp:Transcript_3330/g.12085  ORF Transcript_3330/g.12085 Transcript_3330/m.12085 type:complete len:349 (+) Transcript_3330:89-1135(+)